MPTSNANPTGLRGGPAKRMAPYQRTEGVRPAVHPDGIVTKPSGSRFSIPLTSEGSGSLSRQSPLGGKKQVVDTGAKDQVEIHNRIKRKLGSENKKIIIKRTKGN